MSELSRPFLYVDTNNVSNFKKNDINNSKYKNKIAFLGNTGQIATNGNLYGVDNSIVLTTKNTAEYTSEETLSILNSDD